MISSLQPRRPRNGLSPSPAPSAMALPPPSPLNQQPTRTLSNTSTLTAPIVPLHSTHSTHCFPQVHRPRTQIEALPPGGIPQDFNLDQFLRPGSAASIFAPVIQPPAPHQYDPATRHPVFFTRTLQKPPFGVGAGHSVSPVAMGYVENSVSNRIDGGRVKL